MLAKRDCDMTRGASGGPVFVVKGGRGVVVGVNVSEYRYGEVSLKRDEYTEAYSNQAVPARTFAARAAALTGRGSPTPNPPLPPPRVEELIQGYLSLELVRVGDDIGVKSAYEPCYAKIRQYVEILPQSYLFPYGIDVRGTREAMIKLIDEQPCTDHVHHVAGDQLIPLRDKRDYRGAFVKGMVGLELVHVGDRIDVRSSYEPCYEEMERQSGILSVEPLASFPYDAYVEGRREDLARLVGLACVTDVYEKLPDGELKRLATDW